MEILKRALAEGKGVSRRRKVIDSYIVDDALHVACDYYCGNLHRKSSSGGEKRRAYLHPCHLPHADLHLKVVGRSDQSLRWIPNSESIGMPGGEGHTEKYELVTRCGVCNESP